MAPRPDPARPDPVRALLLVLLVAGAAGLPFLSLAPNRIVAARPLSLWQAADPRLLALLAAEAALLALAVPRWRAARALALAAALALLTTLAAAAGLAATALTEGGSPAARVSLGPGFWIAAVATALLLADALQRPRPEPRLKALAAGLLLAAAAGLTLSGTLDALSLARELAARREAFGAALARHMLLVGGALAIALPLGLALGVLAWRSRRAARPAFAVLGLLQTIPSLAMFGLLIGPLTELGEMVPALRAAGISGIGMTPAIVALVLYGLLPIVRSVEAGLGAVSPALLEAARGMGMTGRQILWRVAAPLALPALLGGIRIVAVQLVGLAVVAALIGAGGLGSFVFQGLGQAANDLVLLGALSVIALALLADALLRAGQALAERRFA